MHVLIVDDKEENLYYLQALLTGHGWQVTAARHGAEALVKARQSPPDVVISDLLMPVMDGYTLLRYWKADALLKKLPFIVYTATYTEAEDERLALDLGADAFILKPAEPEDFLSRLQEVQAHAGVATPAMPKTQMGDEQVLLKSYSETLIRKLEEKSLQLEEMNRALEQDIDMRKSAEREIRLNAQRYRSLVEATTAIVWDTPASGLFEADQPGWTSFTGQSFEELRGWGWLNAVHPDDQAETARIWSAAVAGTGTYETEHRLRSRTQGYRNMLVRAVPIFADDGTVHQWTGIHTDITERKQSEEKLRLLGSAVEQSKESILITDSQIDLPGPRILFVNPAFTQMTGYTAEEALGNSPRFLQGPRTDRAVLDRLRQNLQAGVAFAGEAINYRKDGSEFIMEWQIAPIRGADGNVTHFVAIQRDITERQNNERRALRSQRLESLGTLAGGVAHDLNNALAPIMMGVEMIRAKYPKESKIVDMFETSAHRGADMVRQLLSFAKGAEGERVSVEPGRMVKELENMMKGSFPKNIQITVQCAPGLPTVLGDATQLHQVILNLCVNARDAMPHGGTLSLDVQYTNVDTSYASSIPDAREGDYVRLRVGDTGTGIPANIIDRIFDPFFTTKDPDKGTGLGLSTVMGIVKGHGGFLHVSSQPERGSTFSVYLPAELPGSRIEAQPESGGEFRGNGEAVLLVDDEAAVREMARAVLGRLNFKAVTATDGVDGLMRAAEHRKELRAIITDLHMPHMDGLAFVHAVRRMLPDIPVVVSSGRMEDTMVAEFRSLGVTNRLDKPFTEAQLAEALKGLLSPA